jgi:hypothetical protein
MARKSKANYVPNKNIKSITVKRGNKTTEIQNKDILDGAYVKKGVKFKEGGGVLNYSNDENEALGKWLLKTKEGKAILSKAKNAQQLEKLVRDYANKNNGVAGLEMDSDDEGIEWVTFEDLFREVHSRMMQGGSMYRTGGVMGDIYSIQNAEQFKQLMTTYNELSEKFGVVNYFLDHKDNSVAFLMQGDEESMSNTLKLQRYIDTLNDRGFDVFDKTKNKNIIIKEDNSQGGGYVYFKLKLSKIVQYADGGGVGKSKSYLHLYKLTYPNGQYRVESYDGEAMTPKEALEKMRISLRGLKSYKYSSASSDSENYKEWYHRKDIGYSDTEAWDEVFGSDKYSDGGGVGSKKEKAMKKLEKHIKYAWVNTDMGSGWEFTLDGFDLEMRYLDIFDGADIDEDWDSLSKSDKDYYYKEWKEDLWQSSYEQFKKLAFEKYGYYYMEDGGNTSCWCYEVGGL